jgi:signal transduction histidine kinase
MTNAARHSGASRIDVVIGFSGVEAVGSVTDNGQGFEATEGRRTGLGLIGMEERLRELGGNLRVISSSGMGTRIEFRVPGTAETSYSYAENG